MKLSLIENANSFLSEALDRAIKAEYEPLNWKFAVLSLVQAIELALKERLRREHSYLIFANIDKPGNTVSLERAADRLQKIVGLSFHSSDLKSIRTASEIRNMIVHHEFELNTDQTKSVFGKLLGFLYDFYQDAFGMEISKAVPEKYWQEAIEINQYISELYERSRARIVADGDTEKFLMSCPKCLQDTFSWGKGKDRCYLCGYQEEVTVCQECGLLLFQYEAHTVYYGKWMPGDKKEYHDWYPDLCDVCFENYVFDEEAQSVEFVENTI